jgi:hypothetical protein
MTEIAQQFIPGHWFDEKQRELTEGLPQPDQYPLVPRPEEPPSMPKEEISTMSHEDLGHYYQLYSEYQANAQSAAAAYAMLMEAQKQNLEDLRRDANLKLFPDGQPKGKTVAMMAYSVDDQPEVKEALHAYTALKQHFTFFEGQAKSYGTLAILYANERKDRRERRAFGTTPTRPGEEGYSEPVQDDIDGPDGAPYRRTNGRVKSHHYDGSSLPTTITGPMEDYDGEEAPFGRH